MTISELDLFFGLMDIDPSAAATIEPPPAAGVPSEFVCAGSIITLADEISRRGGRRPTDPPGLRRLRRRFGVPEYF